MTIIALCCTGSVCAVGQSQESSRAEADSPEAQAAVDEEMEEIIVLGRNRATLRAQIRLAEEAVYARFNEINSDDEFDIHCRREAQTGSRILRRVCQANFWREAQARAGRETARWMQGSPGVAPEVFLVRARYKRRLLAEEMRRLATEDERFSRTLVRLGSLEQALEERRLPLSSSASTLVHEVTPGEKVLPYDAARIAEVRIGRDPWSRVLIRRTFTIADVYGEIRAVEVDCDGRTEQLQWEAGVEWTLPDNWGSCTLLVQAPLGTTFSVYEFE